MHCIDLRRIKEKVQSKAQNLDVLFKQSDFLTTYFQIDKGKLPERG